MKKETIPTISENNIPFIRRNFSRYLFPAILSFVAGNISMAVDNAIAGLVLGETALAATSIVAPVFNFITMVAGMICGGAAILASICIGEGNHRQKNQLFTLSFYLMVGTGLLFTILGYVFLDPLVRLLGATGELIPLVRDYALVTVCSSIVLMSLYLPVNFLRIAGKTRPTMIMFFIVSFLDITLDLIFTVWFGWGMKGLALGTTLSTLIAVLCVLPVLAARSTGYAFVSIRKPIRDIGHIFKTGSPKAFGCLNTIIGVRVINGLILTAGGSMALAAYNCANSVDFVSLAIVSGISQTVTPIVGVLYGERDKVGIQRTMQIAISSGLGITAICWVAMVFFRYPLAALFGMTSPEQMKLAGHAIAVLNFNMMGSMALTVWGQFYVTTGRVTFYNVLTLVKGLVLDIALALVGSMLWGFTGLLLGLVLSDVVCILIIFIYSSIQKKRENCDNLFLLPGQYFGNGSYMSEEVEPDNVSITETARLAEEFCLDHRINKKQAHTICLGIEECMLLMAENAIGPKEKSGKKRKSDEQLEFRLLISESELVLRIRCFGKRFNPLIYETKDEMKYLGIRMLKGLASDISYSSNMGMNNILMNLSRSHK